MKIDHCFKVDLFEVGFFFIIIIYCNAFFLFVLLLLHTFLYLIQQVNNEEKLTIGFVAFDRNFLLDLRMNKDLLPTHYFEKHQENDSYVTHLPMKYVSNFFKNLFIFL